VGRCRGGVATRGGTRARPGVVRPGPRRPFGYARNDAVDAAADRINRPDRPIPSGRLTAGSAQAVAWICLALGAALTLSQAPRAGHLALYAFAALSLHFYSPWLKNRGALGPAVVALLGGLAVLWGGWIGPHPGRSLAAAGLAVAVTSARECAKDLEDVEGDAPAGKGTWPVRAGEGPPRFALRLASGIGLLLIPVPWMLGDAGPWYVGLSLAVAAPILIWCVALPPRDAVAARRTTRALKVALTAGIAGLWLGAAPV